MNSSYHHRVPRTRRIRNSTSSQLSAISPSIMVPLGSTEQHGPHLPLDTEPGSRPQWPGASGRVLRRGAGGAHQEWLVAPAIAYGASGEHQSFAGTISIGTEALIDAAGGVRQVGRLLGPAAGLHQRPRRQRRRVEERTVSASRLKVVTPGGARALRRAATPMPATPKHPSCCIFRRRMC